MRRPVALLIVTALAVLLCSMLASASIGVLPVPLGTTLDAIVAGVRGEGADLTGLGHVVWTIRVPRVVMAALVGASLGSAGTATQAVFRNPLADPYLLGVASGAVFGATLALSGAHDIDFGFGVPASLGHGTLTSAAAFAGALGAVVVAALVASSSSRGPLESLLLAGVIVGSVLTACSTYLVLREGEHLRAVVSWTLGDLSLSGWHQVGFVAPYAAVSLIVLAAMGPWLDGLQLGDATARTLGLRVGRVRWLALGAAALATAACITAVGAIAFVGLVAPHTMRRLGVPTHRVLVVTSALAGASLLVLADLGARSIARPTELPVGVVLTLVGGPFFLWLLRRS